MATANKTIGAKLVKTSGTSMIVSDLTSLGELSIESEEVDTTTLDSPNGYREYVMTLKDAGEISLTGIVKSPDNFEELRNLQETQSLETWRIEIPQGTKFDFSAQVKMFGQAEITPDGVWGYNATLRISGKPILTIAGDVSA